MRPGTGTGRSPGNEDALADEQGASTSAAPTARASTEPAWIARRSARRPWTAAASLLPFAGSSSAATARKSRFSGALRRCVALAALLLSLSPSSGWAQEPRAAARADLVAHAAVALEFRYDPPDGGLDRPDRVEMTLTLRPEGSGFLVRQLPRGPVDVAAVSWTRRGDRVELAPGTIGYEGSGGLFAWERWSLDLADADADGVLESGRGTATGEWHRMMGDVMDFAVYEAHLEAVPDTMPPTAGLGFGTGPRPLPVDDRVEVAFSEPVRWDPTGVRLLVDGNPEPVRASPIRPVHDHVTGALLELDRLAPFGAALALETSLADPAGHAARWDGDTLRTPADPGPIGLDADFREGLTGWIAEGPASVVDSHPSGEPGRWALVASGGRLTGVLDVPDDALALEIGIEVLSEIGRYDAGRSAVVDLVAAGSRTRVFDVSGTKTGGPCACSPYGTTTGPLEISTSLVELRGRRALVSFAAAASSYLGMNEYAILVGSVRVSQDAGTETRSDEGAALGDVGIHRPPHLADRGVTRIRE